MAEFTPGEQKTAIVPMTNPTAKAFDYVAQLYMGMELAIMSEIPFHLEAGESKDISMLVTMPMDAGVYPVNIGAFSDGQFIEPVYHAEDVTIIPVIPTEGMITLYGTNFPVRGTDWNWCAIWQYADGSSGANPDDYYGWRGPNEACTPAKPIPLNNLSFAIQEGSYEYGYSGKYFGPFVVEDGKIYTINWQTGELSERA